MHTSHQSLIQGTSGFGLAYAVVLIAMLAALLRSRAGLTKLLLAPLLAFAAVLLAALLLSLTSALLQGLGSILQGAWGALICALTGWLGGLWLARRTDVSVQYQRGAVVAGKDAPGSRARRPWLPVHPGGLAAASRLTLAGIPIAQEDETKHFKLIGTTGTGKSTAIQELLSAALARGDRAIIADPDGGYRRRFFNALRGDVVLNPFDVQARRWDLFGEIRTDYDVEQLARSLIPDSGNDHTWSEYARTFFTAIAQQAVRGHLDDSKLYRLLTRAPMTELKQILPATAAAPFVEEGNEKMFGSIRSVASSAVRALQYTTRQEGAPLSVRQWVRRGPGAGGVLFLPYSAGEIAALAPMISAWMRLGIFEAMDQPEGDQRLWFVVDELDALGSIDGLKDALARLRKFGGRCVLGFQSISQVSRTYGKGAADTIVENCGNTLILRCSAGEQGGTSEFASRLIGQREVLQTTRSRTRKPTQLLASTTTAEQVRIEPAVMASEIERLPDLQGFLKLASKPDWRAVTLVPGAAGVPMPDVTGPARAFDGGSDPVQDIGGPAQSPD